MIDYTPRHQYFEIADAPKEKGKPKKNRWLAMIVRCVRIGIIIGLIGGFVLLPVGTMLTILAVLVILLIPLVLILAILIYKPIPPSKNKIASVIKEVLSYDFGSDFKLLTTSSHDYEEYLYIFPPESFEGLRKYLDSIENGPIGDTRRCVSHEYNGVEGAGFTLVENRLDNYGSGNVESIEVDYSERTLKHTFTIY